MDLPPAPQGYELGWLETGQLISYQAEDLALGVPENFSWPNGSLVFELKTTTGRPVAAFGAIPLWPGVAEVFLFGSDEIQAHKVAVCKSVRICLEGVALELDLHRAHTTVDAKSRRNVSFAMSLGFEVEGRLVGWGPRPCSDDYLMMSKLW